jgi:hypothetical protein
MSTRTKFVHPDHVAILEQYLSGEAVALIYPAVQNAAKERGVDDEMLVDYDFGGDPDLLVDVVSDPSHLFLSEAEEYQ